ncbi:hypothetical protein ACC676_25740 [Rhizobium ruizarguesonis]
MIILVHRSSCTAKMCHLAYMVSRGSEGIPNDQVIFAAFHRTTSHIV